MLLETIDLFGPALKVLVQLFELLLREILRSRQAILSLGRRHDQLGQLELYRHRVAILSVLNQEHHQERHDRGRGVDHELPGVAVSEQRPGQCPDQNQQDGRQERQRMPGVAGSAARHVGERGVPAAMLVSRTV